MNNCEEKMPTASSTPTPIVQDIRCYTIEDLMAMLALSRPTVYRLLKQNVFRWFKVGGAYRISKASFDAWLNEGVIEPSLAG
jgi:excisionase family DNA binding protein